MWWCTNCRIIFLAFLLGSKGLTSSSSAVRSARYPRLSWYRCIRLVSSSVSTQTRYHWECRQLCTAKRLEEEINTLNHCRKVRKTTNNSKTPAVKAPNYCNAVGTKFNHKYFQLNKSLRSVYISIYVFRWWYNSNRQFKFLKADFIIWNYSYCRTHV